jgi:pyrimidine-nucleoside phosphorylase
MRTVYEILAAKRDGGELGVDEIRFLVDEFTAGKLPDYQFSAFLMAACINGLSGTETASLTQVMLESGEVLAPSGLSRPLIDKHSTGGVGDKLSLIIAPLLANCDLAVGMISGRGLGHTGGTLDKLEAIPGTQVFHSAATFNHLLKKHHFAITGQTKSIAPADKKIYALRDVTGTVESIPLIVASIMSKKLALKSDGIVFDVKAGNGAFMQTPKEAAMLGAALLEVAQSNGLQAAALITNMDRPTGVTIGNWLEVVEAMHVLQGRGPADTVALTVAVAADMLLVGGVERDRKAAQKRVLSVLGSGAGYECFCRYISACGGDTAVLDEAAVGGPQTSRLVIESPADGYINRMDTRQIGFVALSLGAGRYKASDSIDPQAGIELLARFGDRVEIGQPLAALYSRKRAELQASRERFIEAVSIDASRPTRKKLILRRIVGD